MNAALKLPCDGNPKIIYLIYGFKQVIDSIVMVTSVDKLLLEKDFY